MEDNYNQPERRRFIRLNHIAHLNYKICKKETILKLLTGYTSNISQAGLLCNIRDKVTRNDVLWLHFDRDILNICEELEKRSFIYQNGIIGKVVRIANKQDGSYNVGIKFITREESIKPEIKFLLKDLREKEYGQL